MKTTTKQQVTNDFFADTLQVRRIGPKAPGTEKHEPKQDTRPKKDKYFTDTRFQNYERTDKGPRLDRTGLHVFVAGNTRGFNAPAMSDKLRIPRQLKKAPLSGEIKMISMNIPRFGRGEAILMSNFEKEPKNKKNKVDIIGQEDTPEEYVDTYNYDQLGVLEDAQKEIDVSQNQLEKLRTILKQSKTQDTAPDESIWNTPIDSSKRSDSKEKVLSTLNTLNKKLSNMQEKYFSQPKLPYKSIKDIPSKMKMQSNSDLEISASNSDLDIQVEENIKLLKKLNSTKIQNTQNLLLAQNEISLLRPQFFEEASNQTSLDVIPCVPTEDRGTDCVIPNKTSDSSFVKNSFKFTMDPLGQTDASESNSDTELPKEAKNRILERFHLSKIHKFQESLLEFDKNMKPIAHCDKGQNFSTSVPDVLMRGDDSLSNINLLLNRRANNNNSLNESMDEKCQMNMIKDSDFKSYANFSAEKQRGLNNLLDVEKIQTMLLNQEDEVLKASNSIPTTLDAMDTDREKQTSENTVEMIEFDNLKKKSSPVDFYDCSSKVHSPSTSTKKIFYDNFGRYSSHSGKGNTKWNVEASSVPNLPGAKTIMAETNNKLTKTIFDETPLQECVLKSEFLTKTFTLESSESCDANHPKISKNKSDQFFNGGLDVKNFDNKSMKNAKISKDMYATLTKALSNSFYKLPLQK